MKILLFILISFPTAVWALEPCAEYGPAKNMGQVSETALDEASGLAASRKQVGVLWTHNDSGDDPRVFAMKTDGTALGTWTVAGAEAIDWEDIAIAPCESGDCIYVADIGNNAYTREVMTIYRFPEPNVTAPERITEPATALRFTYPEGENLNAEALMIGPKGEVWVFSKESNRTRLFYAESLHPDRITALLEVAERQVLLTTGADLAPDGLRFVVRGYVWALEFNVRPGELLGQAFVGEPLQVPIANEPQGEAIAYTANSTELLTTSEDENQPIFGNACLRRTSVETEPSTDPPKPEPVEPEPTQTQPNADTSNTSAGCSTTLAPRSLWPLLLIAVWGARYRR